MALSNSAWMPASSLAGPGSKVIWCGGWASSADSARASLSQVASSCRTRTQSVVPGGGLPSRRESVSRSLTSVCMRCDWVAISAR